MTFGLIRVFQGIGKSARTLTMAQQPPFPVSDWQAAAAQKREQLFILIPKRHLLPEELAAKATRNVLLPSDEAVLKCGILNGLDIEITDINDAALLLDRIRGREYTAVQVAEAFCKRASIAQQTINCLTEAFYDQALKRAAELDDHLAREGKPFGPLHGLPVSLKDCYDVARVATTSGLVSWILNMAKKDSAVARALLDAGAVLCAVKRGGGMKTTAFTSQIERIKLEGDLTVVY